MNQSRRAGESVLRWTPAIRVAYRTRLCSDEGSQSGGSGSKRRQKTMQWRPMAPTNGNEPSGGTVATALCEPSSKRHTGGARGTRVQYVSHPSSRMLLNSYITSAQSSPFYCSSWPCHLTAYYLTSCRLVYCSCHAAPCQLDSSQCR